MFSSIKRRLSQGLYGLNAQVAQLVEQGTENPCVGGSIPSLGTILIKRPPTDVIA